MRIRPRYQRQRMQLTVEFDCEEYLLPYREHADVHGLNQARVEMVRIAFMKGVRPTRAWITVYQFGNTTHEERSAAHEFWIMTPWMVCMPPYSCKKIFLIGGDD